MDVVIVNPIAFLANAVVVIQVLKSEFGKGKGFKMNKKPKRWSERKWTDIYSGWQFRTYNSLRDFQLCFVIDDMQGDGFVHLSVHFFKKALAFEFPFNANGKTLRIQWQLVK